MVSLLLIFIFAIVALIVIIKPSLEETSGSAAKAFSKEGKTLAETPNDTSSPGKFK